METYRDFPQFPCQTWAWFFSPGVQEVGSRQGGGETHSNSPLHQWPELLPRFCSGKLLSTFTSFFPILFSLTPFKQYGSYISLAGCPNSGLGYHNWQTFPVKTEIKVFIRHKECNRSSRYSNPQPADLKTGISAKTLRMVQLFMNYNAVSTYMMICPLVIIITWPGSTLTSCQINIAWNREPLWTGGSDVLFRAIRL